MVRAVCSAACAAFALMSLACFGSSSPPNTGSVPDIQGTINAAIASIKGLLHPAKRMVFNHGVPGAG